MSELASDRHAVSSTAWRTAGAALALLLAALLALYAETAADAVRIWSLSSTHAFSYLILPISGYFVWLRRDALAAIAPQPQPGMALLAAPAALAWLVGHLAQAAVLTQFGLVALVQVACLAVLGWRVYRTLLFPLQLLWLLVPFGESLLPALIQVTIVLTVTGLRLTGMEVGVDGNLLVTEIGRFGVVEACSALDFLIGNAVISLVYANLLYQGWRKRTLYVLAGMPVAILANGLRTTSVIYLTYLSDGELDLIADHETYGWLLFCTAVAVQMAVGWRFRDPVAPFAVPAPQPPARPAPGRLAAAAVLVLALAVTAPVLAAAAVARQAPAAVALCPPPALGPTVAAGDWRPRLHGADGVLAARYAVGGQFVDLHVGYYARLVTGREMVNWRNRLDRLPGWHLLEAADAEARIDGEPQQVQSLLLRGPQRARRLVWRVYWIDGHLVATDWLAKLLRARAAILDADGAATIMISTDAADPPAARAALQRLLDRAVFVAPLLQAARSRAGC